HEPLADRPQAPDALASQRRDEPNGSGAALRNSLAETIVAKSVDVVGKAVKVKDDRRFLGGDGTNDVKVDRVVWPPLHPNKFAGEICSLVHAPFERSLGLQFTAFQRETRDAFFRLYDHHSVACRFHFNGRCAWLLAPSHKLDSGRYQKK